MYDLSFRADDCSVCLVGPKDVYFLVRGDNSVASARAWRKERGLIRIEGSVAQPLSCVAYAGTTSRCIAGTLTGDLYVFDDSQHPAALVAMLRGHDAAISCVWSHPRALVLITSSIDGSLLCWNARDLSIRGEPTQFKRSATSAPRSICLRGGDLYVGMSSADVWLLEGWLGDGSCIDGGSEAVLPHPSAAKRRLLSCHAGGVNCVAPHPSNPLCVTGGDDGTVRMWDLARCSSMPACTRNVRLRDVLPDGRSRTSWPTAAISAVSFRPPHGVELAVCLGAPALSRRAGERVTSLDGAGYMCVLLPKVTGLKADGGSAYEFEVLHPGVKISKSWLTDLRYSPNGQLLAVGSDDRSIYILDASTGYVMRSQLKGHYHSITHLDWSCNARFLRSNGQDLEIKFWDVWNGKEVPRAVRVRDVAFSSGRCTLAWGMHGAHPAPSEPTTMNASDLDAAQELLVTARGDGTVGIHAWPAAFSTAPSRILRGHSMRVNDVALVSDAKTGTTCVVSVGAEGIAIVWALS